MTMRSNRKNFIDHLRHFGNNVDLDIHSDEDMDGDNELDAIMEEADECNDLTGRNYDAPESPEPFVEDAGDRIGYIDPEAGSSRSINNRPRSGPQLRHTTRMGRQTASATGQQDHHHSQMMRRSLRNLIDRDTTHVAAWTTIFENGSAVPKHAIYSRSERHRRHHRHLSAQVLTNAPRTTRSTSSHTFHGYGPSNMTIDENSIPPSPRRAAQSLHGHQPSASNRLLAQDHSLPHNIANEIGSSERSLSHQVSMPTSLPSSLSAHTSGEKATESSPFFASSTTSANDRRSSTATVPTSNVRSHATRILSSNALMSAGINQQQPSTTLEGSPNDFKYTKDVCALSWWRPIKLLEEGSISDIHLVKRRANFTEIKYKEKRNVMDVAKKNILDETKTMAKSVLSTLFNKPDNGVSVNDGGAVGTSHESRNVNNDNGDDDVDDDPTDREIRVLKSIHKDHVNDDDVLAEMRQEILVMSDLNHPNIVHLIEAYERIRHIYLVMEFCPGGNLTNRKYDERQCNVVIEKVLSALQYMHERGIAHRDLKLENLMLDKDGDVKLIDFGLATKFLGDDYTNMTETVGTLYSMAPEVLRGKSYDPMKSDMWSLGVVSYVLLSQGVQPFWGPRVSMPWSIRRKVMIENILNVYYRPMTGPKWRSISDHGISFVKSLLQGNALQRPTASQAYESLWIQSGKIWRSAQTLPNTNVTIVSATSPASPVRMLDDDIGGGGGGGDTAMTNSTRSSLLGDTNSERHLHGLTDFRRKAWRLLTTKLDYDDISRLQVACEKADASGEGSISIKTLVGILEHQLLSSTDIESLRHLLESLDHFDDDDSNNSHAANSAEMKLDYIGFVDELKRGKRRLVLDGCALTFDTMDLTGNRRVDVGELLKVLNSSSLPGVPTKLQTDLFEEVIRCSSGVGKSNDNDVATASTIPLIDRHDDDNETETTHDCKFDVDENGEIKTSQVLKWIERKLATTTTMSGGRDIEDVVGVGVSVVSSSPAASSDVQVATGILSENIINSSNDDEDDTNDDGGNHDIVSA
jgi:serine/threonine protein kinase/Ca2+-binding EF-hand superfamily protein